MNILCVFSGITMYIHVLKFLVCIALFNSVLCTSLNKKYFLLFFRDAKDNTVEQGIHLFKKHLSLNY